MEKEMIERLKPLRRIEYRIMRNERIGRYHIRISLIMTLAIMGAIYSATTDWLFLIGAPIIVIMGIILLIRSNKKDNKLVEEIDKEFLDEGLNGGNKNGNSKEI